MTEILNSKHYNMYYVTSFLKHGGVTIGQNVNFLLLFILVFTSVNHLSFIFKI